MKYPTVITDQTVTVVVDGHPLSTDRTNTNWERIKEALNDPEVDPTYLKNLFSPATGISYASRNYGEIEVVDGTLLFEGQEVHSALASRILDLYLEGLDLKPWVNFAHKVYANPDTRARDELYLWLEKSNLPICDDGDFWAWKIVREDFTDTRTGTFDNSPGKIVSMPREEVDTDRDRTCSQGLHFCSKEYLPFFGWNRGTSKVVLVKINPADVVSIPNDHDNAKGRTWRYEVVSEFTDNPLEKEWQPVYNGDNDEYSLPDEDFDDWEDEDDDWEYPLYDDDDDDDFDQEHVASETGDVQVGTRVMVDLDEWWPTLSEDIGPFPKVKGTVVQVNNDTILGTVRIQVDEDDRLKVEDITHLWRGGHLNAEWNGFTVLENSPVEKKETTTKGDTLTTSTKSKKAVTIQTDRLGTLSRKEYKDAVRRHGSAEAWARDLEVPGGTVRKWKARLWPR